LPFGREPELRPADFRPPPFRPPAFRALAFRAPLFRPLLLFFLPLADLRAPDFLRAVGRELPDDLVVPAD
jgi:hypothetical protein